jgi:YbbR domain-containing protein
MKVGQWMRENASTFLLSLVLAFFFWAAATEAENPTEERPYPYPLPVEVRGVPEGMMAYGAEEVRVRVVLRAPQDLWPVLQKEDIVPYVDLHDANVGPEGGEVTLPVRVEFRRRPLQVVQMSPQEITFYVEPTAEVEVPVVVVTEGAPVLGFVARAPIYAPRTVLVQGPKSKVEAVAQARVTVSVADRRDSVIGDFSPTAVDGNGDPVPYVTLIPDTITVQVPIEQLGNIRDLAVRVVLSGQPAPGYAVTGIEVQPPVVTVIGRRDVVQSISGYLETKPIAIDGATAPITATAELNVPEGLSVLVTPQVLVRVEIEPLESTFTLQVTPVITGLGRGLTATVKPESAQLVITGPFDVVNAVDPATIHLYLDASGLGPGTYTLAPQVILPQGLRVKEILPQPSFTMTIR